MDKMDKMDKLKIVFTSQKEITLELEEDKGVVHNRSCTYRFNQKDSISDIVSDVSLIFLINSTLGNAVFMIIEDWLEETE